VQIVYDGQTLSNGGTDGPQTISAAPSRVADASHGLRGEFANVTDQRGKANVLSWTQQRTHANAATALSYLFTHLAGLPDGRHDATLTTEAGTVHTLSSAVLIPGAATINGTVTTHSYELRGSAISGAAPAPLPPRGPAQSPLTHLGAVVTHLGETVTHG